MTHGSGAPSVKDKLSLVQGLEWLNSAVVTVLLGSAVLDDANSAIIAENPVTIQQIVLELIVSNYFSL